MARKPVTVVSIDLTYAQAGIVRSLLKAKAQTLGFESGMEIPAGSKLGELRSIDRKIRTALSGDDFE